MFYFCSFVNIIFIDFRLFIMYTLNMREDFVGAHTVEELVDRGKYMVLSTVGDDGFPHTTPVFYNHGPAGCFYWLSTLHAEHSQNIMKNHRVSGVIMDTTQNQGEGFALYFKGRGELFHKPNNNDHWGNEYHFGHAVRAFCAASNTLKDKVDVIMNPLSPRKLFRLKIEQAWVNGAEFDKTSGLWIDKRKPVKVGIDHIGRGFGELKITG